MCAALVTMCLRAKSILAVLVGAVMPMRSPMTLSLRCVCNLVFLFRYMRPEGPWQRRGFTRPYPGPDRNHRS